ncbi:hypothetical protein PV325_000307, partial [Microctonus aethiopoides]
EPRQSVLQTVAWQNNSDNYFPHNRNRFERGRLSREDSSVNHEDELYNRESQLQYNTFSQPSQRRRNCSRQNFLGDSGQENIDEQTFQNESRYPILCQNNNELSISSSINIGRIVNTWNLAFPKDERDPEQFIMLLEDHLQTYGINKNLFVPCLSRIFTGGHRAWYMLNKRNWRTWEDFTRAFRYQWSVKKSDGDLFLELNELNLDKGETLAELTCRARLIFERMMYPPTFKEQLKQILVKFNPRLTFELMNLPLHNYEEFLHYVSERSYLFRRSGEINKNTRFKTERTDLKYLQDETDIAEKNHIQTEIYNIANDDEITAELNAMEQRSFRSNT